MAIVTTASSVSSTALISDFMAASRRPGDRPEMSRVAAVFRQHWLDPLLQARLRERMRNNRAGEEEQREKKHELQRHQTQTRLQTHSEDQKADAERVGDTRCMHASEYFRHANQSESTHEREERTEEDQHPTRYFDEKRHDLRSSSAA